MSSKDGLSSRVLNMKFMRQAAAKEEDRQEEEKVKKVRDLSEWVLPNAKKIKPKPKVATIGYGSVNSFDEERVEEKVITGRKNWGLVTKEEESKYQMLEEQEDPKESEKKVPTDYLDKLFKKQDSKKRPNANDPNSKKRQKTDTEK